METEVTPTYYLHDDQELYYYSAIDAVIATEYQSLPKHKKAMFDPMITGFNPTDGWAVDHIKQMLLKFPNVFSGIGEFSIKKEVVSSKIAGNAANIEDPALGKVLNLAAEIGLIAILHCDIDAMLPSSDSKKPVYLDGLARLFKKYSKTKIIWAHTGLGRYVKARPKHTHWIASLLDENKNLYVDISWDLVAEEFFQQKTETLKPEWKSFFINYADRVLFGTDVVAPTKEKYHKALALYDKIWKDLPKQVVHKITYENYIKLFDNARKKVRSWEKAQLKKQ